MQPVSIMRLLAIVFLMLQCTQAPVFSKCAGMVATVDGNWTYEFQGNKSPVLQPRDGIPFGAKLVHESGPPGQIVVNLADLKILKCPGESCCGNVVAAMNTPYSFYISALMDLFVNSEVKSAVIVDSLRGPDCKLKSEFLAVHKNDHVNLKDLTCNGAKFPKIEARKFIKNAQAKFEFDTQNKKTITSHLVDKDVLPTGLYELHEVGEDGALAVESTWLMVADQNNFKEIKLDLDNLKKSFTKWNNTDENTRSTMQRAAFYMRATSALD